MFMSKKNPLKSSLVALIIFSCFIQCNSGSSEYERLNAKYDSLNKELTGANNIVKSLEYLVLTLDSIELGYENITFDLEIGTDYTNYKEKMKRVLSYVQKAESNISELESNSSISTFHIKSLKNELNLKIKKINELEAAINELKSENIELFDIISVQGKTLHDKSVEIQILNQNIELIEAHVVELLKQAEVNEANAFFARGSALEQAANRTKLAPRKKKETLYKALSLFKKAMELGNETAKDKVNELQMKLGLLPPIE